MIRVIWITDPDPDHPKGMHPVIKLLGSNFHGFQKEIVGGGPLVFENLRWLLTWPQTLEVC